MEQQPLLDNPVALSVVVALYAVLLAFTVYLYVRIIRKAGFSGWWALAAFVPLLNLVMIVVFAFVEWPVERRARQAGGYGGPGAYGLPGA